MASFEEAIAGVLLARTAISDLVGTRVYDTILPQVGGRDTTLPAITFQIVDRRDEPHFLGNAPEFSVQVQLDVWAVNAASRRTVAAVLRALMAEWRGPWGGLAVRRAFKVSDFDSTEPRDDGASLPTFRNTQRWTVWIRQAPLGVT